MNEGQSQDRSPRHAGQAKILRYALAAFLPLLGASALLNADRAFGQDGLFGLDIEQADQAPIPAPSPLPDSASEEGVAPGAVVTAQEIPLRDIPGGVASWYGSQFDGKRTASGERFDPDELTAAHRTLPFGSRVRVKCARTGKTVVVRINDRGPFGHGRVIDLSQAAAKRIGITQAGSGPVSLALLDR